MSWFMLMRMVFLFFRGFDVLFEVPQHVGCFLQFGSIAFLLQAELDIFLLVELEAVSIACLLKINDSKRPEPKKKRKKHEKMFMLMDYAGNMGWLGCPLSVVSISSWSFYGVPHGHPRLAGLGSRWCSRRNASGTGEKEFGGCFRWCSFNSERASGFLVLGLRKFLK